MAKTTADRINETIEDAKTWKKDAVDTNEISDGYHTFGELYDHRIALFIALCHLIDFWNSTIKVGEKLPVWKSKFHSDGSQMEGWFIAGIHAEKGKQISYHLPMEMWDKFEIPEVAKAPKWDGHTPADVVERLLKL